MLQLEMSSSKGIKRENNADNVHNSIQLMNVPKF